MSTWGEWAARCQPTDLIGYLDRARREPLPTGTPLDAALGGGLMPGVTVLGGVASAGKSAIACDAAQHVAASGRRVLYLTLDDSRASILKRCAAAWSCSQQARDQGCEPVRWPRIDRMVADELRGATDRQRAAFAAMQRAGTACRALQLFNEACPGLVVEDALPSAPAACGQVRQMAEEGERPHLVVVDYVQQYVTGEPNTDAQEYARVAAVATAFQRLALDLNVPVLELSSLRKVAKAERGDPQLDWLRGNGVVGYAAWAAAIVTRSGADGAGTTGIELNVVKNKAGRAGMAVSASLYGAYSRAVVA